MNRQNRSQLAEETLTILQSGVYATSRGIEVSISDAVATSCEGTELFFPEDYPAMLERVGNSPTLSETVISVSNRTTLQAGHDFYQRFGQVACLNFASAKNPGGGFLSGSQAQEESLARASGLYATLQPQTGYYDFHRHCGTCIYSDRAIYSPGVPVFRDDSGQLLQRPWTCDFITAAAVNAGAVRRNEPGREGDIVPLMEQRTRVVLSIAISKGCRNLVLGAWGCGVFQNDPATIAGVFARVLEESSFKNRFENLEFAVLDGSAAKPTFRAFEEQFSSA
ncbi:TIGR02452 family protein [bacterium]|nr:MAG: TIGR02452 family protein [bacterium]